jgi:hypothetical protein
MYALAVFIFCTALGVYVLRDILFPTPTCFDAKQNGYESGIDCGGVCSLRCEQEIIPLTVLWSRHLRVATGTYDLVAMVHNKNINNASKALGYTFSLYNKEGGLLGEYSGTTTAPVDGDFPIIIQSATPTGTPETIAVHLNDTEHYSVEEKPTLPTVRVGNEEYEPGSIPRVYAMVMNTKRVVILDLPVRVVLYDADDNAYAVAQTVIPRLDKEEIKDITFTWNAPLPYAPTKIRVYPIFNPFVTVQ